MLESFFQNASVSMTKEAYFEMCESLGTEPAEEEIPIEMQDFPIEVQQAIDIYYRLRDEWDTLNGNYLGKSYAGFMDILDIVEIPQQDRKWIMDWISIMDTTRTRVIQNSKQKAK